MYMYFTVVIRQTFWCWHRAAPDHLPGNYPNGHIWQLAHSLQIQECAWITPPAIRMAGIEICEQSWLYRQAAALLMAANGCEAIRSYNASFPALGRGLG